MVLVYHKVADGLFLDFTSVPIKRFTRDMRIIADFGFKCVPIGDYIKAEDKSKIVGLGFDDGYKDIIENVYHVLFDLGFRATIFPVVGYLGKKNYWEPFFGGRALHLSIDDLYWLVEHGFELGSHSMTHRNLLKLKSNELRYELKSSYDILSYIAGKPIEIISFPFSMYNRRVTEIALEIGYKYIVTIQPPRHNSDRIISAYGVYKYEPEFFFRLKLKGSKIENLRCGIISYFSRFSALLK